MVSDLPSLTQARKSATHTWDCAHDGHVPPSLHQAHKLLRTCATSRKISTPKRTSLRGVGLVGDRLSAFTLCFLILGYKSNFYFKIKIYIYTNKHTRQPDARTSICITWNHSWSGRGPRGAPHLTPPSGLRDHLESHSSIPDPHSSGE